MKQVSQAFKDAIKQMGRQIDVILEYRNKNEYKALYLNDLMSVNVISNTNILKSLMKQLNFESSIKVDKNSEVKLLLGVLVDNGITVQEVHEMKVSRLNTLEVKKLQSFEYINLGNYIVAEEPEYNADTNSYSHKCFDKMIYSMKQNEELNITYPISIKNYLKAVCNKIGLDYEDTTFANQSRQIQKELYAGLEYTYRDILDEIAQATGSIIFINDENKLEVGYLNNTNETINEEWLKDINVNMKEIYGPVNSIVLSRSAGSDNVYIQNEQSVKKNGLCEIKIADNQILNWEDRETYLQGLLEKLDGLTYTINDIDSKGITYLDIRDMYNIQINGIIYPCLMLNDEITITQGLTESIYTEMPEQSQTDYSKADKTDRKFEKVNNALIEVDKREGRIELEVSHKLDEDKFTSAEIIMAINGDESSTEIHADKISLAGKEIDLTADNVTIDSDNFSVDRYGNMSCSNANISGTITATSGNFENCNVQNSSLDNSCSVAGGSIVTGSNNRIDDLYVNRLHAFSSVADFIGTSNDYGTYSVGNYTGQTVKVPVPVSITVVDGRVTAQTWNRLVFRGGILVDVETEWN